MYSPELGETLVSYVETRGCVYDTCRPVNAIESGELLELVDFQNSARSIGSLAALGTRVYKESILVLNTDRDTDPVEPDNNISSNPFEHVWRLSGNPRGITIWTSYPNVHLQLQDYYIRSQALKDFYDGLNEQQKLVLYAKKGSLVVRDVIYDDGSV